MVGRDIIVIGASSGGVEALRVLVGGLPAGFSAAIFIVLHLGPGASALPDILSRAGPLPARHPRDGEAVTPGTIMVAPPDLHMMLESGRVRLVHGPRENRMRPAVDALFRSAAIAYGPRVIGVVLTGWLDDGSAGLLAIKDRGGMAIVQDPAEAVAPSMPAHAAAGVAVDHCCPVAEIAPLLVRHDPLPPGSAPAIPPLLDVEHRLTAMTAFPAREGELAQLGTPTALTCPECGGVLVEVHDRRVLRYRCRAGHAWAAGNLLHSLAEAREAALLSALRMLAEEAALARRMAERARAQGDPAGPALDARADGLATSAEALRRHIRAAPVPRRQENG